MTFFLFIQVSKRALAPLRNPTIHMPLSTLRFFLTHLYGYKLYYAMLASVANSSRLLHIPLSNQFQKPLNLTVRFISAGPHLSLSTLLVTFEFAPDKSKFYKDAFYSCSWYKGSRPSWRRALDIWSGRQQVTLAVGRLRVLQFLPPIIQPGIPAHREHHPFRENSSVKPL